jgi:Holliday junction resolvase
MAQTPEKAVKAKVVKILRDMGIYYFFPVTGGFGRSGVPDIVGCYEGRFIAIECKAGGNHVTALQEREMARIKQAGGMPFVIRETTVDDLQAVLNELKTFKE